MVGCVGLRDDSKMERLRVLNKVLTEVQVTGLQSRSRWQVRSTRSWIHLPVTRYLVTMGCSLKMP
jgi:hypothetical protein